MSTPPRIANVANTHLIWVLLGTWVVYGYRDIYPLGTFTLEPLDLHEGWLMWVKFGTLTFAAVIIPSFVPTQYIPLYPKVRSFLLTSNPAPILTSLSYRTRERVLTPSKQPHGSHSFSSFSWATSFQRHLVSPTCPPKNSHPLLTTIWRLTLSRRVFPYVSTYHACAPCHPHSNHSQHLDPLSGTVKRHMFFGLMKVFRREYIAMCSLLVLKASAVHGALRRWH